VVSLARAVLAGVIKATTAAASIPTAILLARLVPDALALPSVAQWIQANAALQNEVHDRRELGIKLTAANEELEAVVNRLGLYWLVLNEALPGRA
jgi:hypothetical protein